MGLDQYGDHSACTGVYPLSVKPISDHWIIPAVLFASLAYCYLRAADGNKTVCLRVVCLLRRCCPAAIFRRVIPAFIWPPIKCRSSWAHPHVSEEIRETLSPSFADRNTDCPVSLKNRRGRVVASSYSSAPTHVFRRPFAVGVMAMLRHLRRNARPFFASATSGSSNSKPMALNGSLRAAFANAAPISGAHSRPALIPPNDTQRREHKSSQIEEFTHV